MTTTFGQINVFVANIDATFGFYRLLELDVPDPLQWPAGSGAQHVESPISNRCYVAFDNHPQAEDDAVRLGPRGPSTGTPPTSWPPSSLAPAADRGSERRHLEWRRPAPNCGISGFETQAAGASPAGNMCGLLRRP